MIRVSLLAMSYLLVSKNVHAVDAHEQSLASSSPVQLKEYLEQLHFLQTEPACLDAASSFNDSFQAFDEACQDMADIIRARSISDEVLTTTCDTYNQECSSTAFAFATAAMDVLRACTNVTSRSLMTTRHIEVATPQIEVVFASPVTALVANTKCLNIDQEYCFFTMRDAMLTMRENLGGLNTWRCMLEIANGTVACHETCGNEVDLLINSTGCCPAAIFGTYAAFYELINTDVGMKTDVLIDAQMCGRRFPVCPGAEASFDETRFESTGTLSKIDRSTTATEPAGTPSSTAATEPTDSSTTALL